MPDLPGLGFRFRHRQLHFSFSEGILSTFWEKRAKTGQNWLCYAVYLGLIGFVLALFFWPLQRKNWLCSAKSRVFGSRPIRKIHPQRRRDGFITLSRLVAICFSVVVAIMDL